MSRRDWSSFFDFQIYSTAIVDLILKKQLQRDSVYITYKELASKWVK